MSDSQFIQIGVTALRDPVTGEMLPSVPLYVRKADAVPQLITTLKSGALFLDMANKVGDYIKTLGKNEMVT